MSARAVLGLTTALLVAAVVPARAEGPVPLALKSFKPYQVVEQIMAQRQLLNLTEVQFVRLDDLSQAIRSEKHRYTHQGGKPHITTHLAMVTPQQAYYRAFAILTPDQQARLEALFPVPAPRRPAPHKYTAPHSKP